MRKNTARKWVHLLLDLLPVLIIPIFAIYTINHEPQGITIEREEYKQVDFNQLNLDPIPNYLTYYEPYNSSFSNLIFENNLIKVDVLQSGSFAPYLRGVRLTGLPNLIANHKYLFRFDIFSNDYTTYYSVSGNGGGGGFTIDLGVSTTKEIIFTASGNYSTLISYSGNDNFLGSFYVSNLYFFDLTQMFGQGNEPSISTFDSIYPYAYYPYTLSEYQYITIGDITYTNTDVGSQFIYALYKPVHDYFNMTNLFNFGDIYTWINNSMFSGNAPLPIFIVYNVIVYEFLIDLIFLIYSIFMFIIDFSSELLARCFSFSNKGGAR